MQTSCMLVQLSVIVHMSLAHVTLEWVHAFNLELVGCICSDGDICKLPAVTHTHTCTCNLKGVDSVLESRLPGKVCVHT